MNLFTERSLWLKFQTFALNINYFLMSSKNLWQLAMCLYRSIAATIFYIKECSLPQLHFASLLAIERELSSLPSSLDVNVSLVWLPSSASMNLMYKYATAFNYFLNDYYSTGIKFTYRLDLYFWTILCYRWTVKTWVCVQMIAFRPTVTTVFVSM